MKRAQRTACCRCHPQSFCLLLVLALPLFGRAQSMEADFAWLDTLGLPGTKGLAFKKAEKKEAGRKAYYGFHLEGKKDPDYIWLLTLDLIPLALPREEFRALEVHSLEAYAGVLLKEDDPAKFWQVRGEVSWRAFFPNRSHACLVAWLAGKRGLDEIAGSLYQRARELPHSEYPILFRTSQQKEKPERTFRQSLEEEIGRTMMSQTLNRLGSPFPSRSLELASRPELLEAFKRHQRCFPNSPEAEFVRRAVELLRQMIAEDADHQELTPEQLGRLPVEQQVEEWLYRLREERGHLSGDGDCYVGSDGLAKLGYPAVPRLIEALDDDRFTRGIRGGSGFWGSRGRDSGVRVVRVGDVAANALMNITREQFFDPRSVYLGDTSPKAVEQRKQFAEKARVWWANFEKTGEEQMLVEGVRRGGREAARKADLLVRRYPDRALETIIAGLEVTKDDKFARHDLLDTLRKVQGEKSDAFFLREANSEPDLSCRTLSARILFRRGKRSEAVASMLKAWRNREQWLNQDEITVGNTIPDLIEFLVACNDPAVIEEIEGDFDGLPVDLRYGIVEKLSRVRDFMARSGLNEPRGYSQEFREAVHALLAGAARDDDIRWHLPLMGSPDRRVADAAVKALSHWRPEDFPRHLYDTFRQREQARFKTLIAISKEENAASPEQPAWLGPMHLKSVNQVVGIEWRGLLAENPPAWFEPLSGVDGDDLDIDLLCGVFNGFAGDKKIEGKTLVVSAIRHGNRTGVSLIADLYPNARPLSQKSILTTRNSMGSWHSYEKQTHWEEHHAETAEVLKRMLGDTSKNELRLRLVLMKR